MSAARPGSAAPRACIRYLVISSLVLRLTLATRAETTANPARIAHRQIEIVRNGLRRAARQSFRPSPWGLAANVWSAE